MKILVTGASGFIGSSLVPKLIELNHDVFCLERLVTGRFSDDRRKAKTVFGDLREYFAIRQIIHEIQPEVVIHLASISPVSYSYEHPMEVTEANFNGTINLAEACLREAHSFKHFLFAGTSEEYGNQTEFPIKETAELRPNSPYSVSKVAADKYLWYMKEAYDFPCTILRNFNTYGRRDNANYIVERITVQMLQGKTIRLGDPTPTRDLQYVDDSVSAYLACLNNRRSKGEVINFCTGVGVTIAQLVKKLVELSGFEGEIIWNTIPKRPLDIAVVIGDNTKARHLLDWQPTVPLEQGLKLTLDYWRAALSRSSPSLTQRFRP
jgi:nucleoside-diphosphate-sugar epimerase